MTTTTLETPVAGPGTATIGHNLPTGDELLLLVAKEPELALTNEAYRDGLIAALEELVANAPTATAIEADRKAIREHGRKVSTYKNAIDKARLSMTAGLREQVSAINEVGKTVDGKLQALQDRVEAPLKAWKEAEDRRLAAVDRVFNAIRNAALGIHTLPSSAIAERIAGVEALEFPATVFTEGTMAVEDERDGVLRQLRDAKAAAEQREAEAAELAKLREEAAERARQDAEREAEAQRIARAEQAAAEAAAREKADSDRRVREAAEAAEREAQRQIDEANERAAEAERQAQAERDRIAAEQREAERLRQVAADAEEARKRDQAHRAGVHAKAGAAIEALGITAARADKIILAIAAGNVPAVSIQY